MKTRKRIVNILVILIIIFAVVACSVALFAPSDGESYFFQSLRGEKVEIYGKGIYKYDSLSMAVQAIAQDYVTLFVAVPLLVIALIMFNKNMMKGKLLLAGIVYYFFYTYFLYAFTSAFNGLFLVYIALYSMSVISLILIIMNTDLIHTFLFRV